MEPVSSQFAGQGAVRAGLWFVIAWGAIAWGAMVWSVSVMAQETMVRQTERVVCIGPEDYSSLADGRQKLLAAVSREVGSREVGSHLESGLPATFPTAGEGSDEQAVQVWRVSTPEFYNSAGRLNEICVRVWVYEAEGGRQLFTLQPVQAKRICDNGIGTLEERRAEVEDRLRSKALIAFEGRLAHVEAARRGVLLREVRLIDEWVDADTGVYCAGLTGRVMPFEVYTLLGLVPTPPHAAMSSPTLTPVPWVPLQILEIAPKGALPVGNVLIVRGQAPPGVQIEVLAGGAPLGVTSSAENGGWQMAIPFNRVGAYRLTTRLYLADGTTRPGSRDALIQVVAPTATPTATPTPVVEILSQRLNVRAGPGTEYAIIETVSRGMQLNVTGKIEKCAWVQVRLEDGQIGWVSGNAQYTRLSVACERVAFNPTVGAGSLAATP